MVKYVKSVLIILPLCATISMYIFNIELKGFAMWIILDAAVVAIIAFSIVAGYRKGFVKTSFKFGMLVAAVVIANSFSPMFSDFLQTTEAYESITNDIRSKISTSVFESGTSDTQQSEQSSAFESFSVLSKLGIDMDLAVENYNKALEEGKDQAVKTLEEYIVVPICRMITDAASFVVVLLASILVLTILMWILELVFKLPVLKTLNKSAGACAGILFGLLKVFVLCVVIQLILPYIPENEIGFYNGVEEKTYIYSIVKEVNPLSFIYK